MLLHKLYPPLQRCSKPSCRSSSCLPASKRTRPQCLSCQFSSWWRMKPQRVTPANVVNFSTVRRPTSRGANYFHDHIRSWGYIENGQRKNLTSSTGMKPPKSIEVAAKPYTLKYKVSIFQKFDGRNGNQREHVACFLDSMGPYAHDIDFCLREFSKSLIDRRYAWYVNLSQIWCTIGITLYIY